VAYERKLVPSSGKGSSISVSGAFCQEEARDKDQGIRTTGKETWDGKVQGKVQDASRIGLSRATIPARLYHAAIKLWPCWTKSQIPVI